VRGVHIVTLKEDAMTRLESSAWPLAGGGASVFVLAVVLDRLPWQAGFAAVVVAVLVWAWLSPLVTGAALAGIGWFCVTGFDVRHFGEIRITGRDDALRAATLLLAGLLAVAAHALAEARKRYRTVDPLWAEFHETGLEHADGLEPNQIAEAPAERPFPRIFHRGTE
jgi:hypothetical protein